MKSKKKLVEEYLDTIANKLNADYGLSLDDAVKAVEDLDLLNLYKDNYEFLLHEDISTWVNLIVNRHKKEMKRENLKNKTTVKPQSNHILVYTKQPTTKNTKPGDVVLYKKEVWINDGHIVASIPSKNVDEEVEKTLKENTMDNYIVINGKKLELTEEQLKQLGIEVDEKRNSPFDRVSRSESYYFIHSSDSVNCAIEDCPEVDHHYFDNANYFNDTDFANQVMLHQQLYRKLLKYAYDNNAEDREWDKASVNSHYFIYFDSAKGHFVVGDNHYCHSQSIYFSSENVAKQAIQDVVEPFLAEHPEFIW